MCRLLLLMTTGLSTLVLLCVQPAHTGHINPAPMAQFTATVTVDQTNITHRIAEETNGCHFSPLDHQLFYVYSQMVYDESFEQSIADKPLDKFNALNNISLGWMNLSLPPAGVNSAGSAVKWVDDPGAAFNGNVSVNLTLHGDTSEEAALRVGVAARGLYHQGFALQQAKPYTGYVAVKASKPSTVHVRLEDWGDDPYGRNVTSASSLAHAALHYPGTGSWVVLNFTLVASASTSCKPFPFGQEPLSCGIPNSQDDMPASATATCVVCAGTLTVAIEDPGTEVSIDQVFLEPGEWGRYKGLHMHRAAADWLLAMGTRMVRYGGTFTQTVQGHWKSERGPSYTRPPCTAGKNGPHGGGRGGCHLTKLARWTRGWGVLEVIEFCEAAGLTMCTVGLADSETAQDLADFVEYLYGGMNTRWGALRAADGHPAPYPAVAIEISNEACMDSFNGVCPRFPPANNRRFSLAFLLLEHTETFAPKIAAMEQQARLHGMGQQLRYVTGSYLGITSPSSKCPGSPNTTYQVFQEVARVGLCGQLYVDTHITPSSTLEGSKGTQELAAQMQVMARSVGCEGLKLVVLEENLCHNHFERALHNGGAAAGLQGIATLAAAATSQCWSAAAHADGCGEGHIMQMPDLTWAQPPFYASQMVYTNYLQSAIGVHATPIAPPKLPGTPDGFKNLTVFAVSSNEPGSGVDSGRFGELVLRFVNDNNRSVAIVLDIVGGRSAQTVAVQTLQSPLFGTPLWNTETDGGWNSPHNTTFISPTNSEWTWPGSEGAMVIVEQTYELPPESFVVFRFSKP